MKGESIARVIFIIFAVLICEAFQHFVPSLSELDVIRFLVILVIFENFKGELNESNLSD